jgi:hypothetical protein
MEMDTLVFFFFDRDTLVLGVGKRVNSFNLLCTDFGWLTCRSGNARPTCECGVCYVKRNWLKKE